MASEWLMALSTPEAAALAALASHLTQRREAVLRAWRAEIAADPTLTTGAALPRAQLHDHIPALLEDFERRLRTPVPETAHAGNAAAHGLHRWQQGFDLAEVARELGRLNECVVSELDSYAIDAPAAIAPAMATARLMWAQIYSVAVSASTSQYFKLQQLEATSHVHELEQALRNLQELERHRATLWQQAAHDLRGNLGVVANATAGLRAPSADESARATFVRLLGRNVQALHRLLDDVTALARLQGGQETRQVAPVDVGALLTELGESLQPLAAERQLFLTVRGPLPFEVQADAVKVRRIAQNLVLNAIRYTRRGGVSLSWGDSGPQDGGRWVLQVQDTGPGIEPVTHSVLANALEVATDNARQVAVDAATGTISHVQDEQAGLADPPASAPPAAAELQPGEGVGLSIVKRLCDLLDATVNLDSGASGTTFRILLPRTYGG